MNDSSSFDFLPPLFTFCVLVNLSPARGKSARGRGRGRGRKATKKEESSDEGEEELMNEDETGGMGRTIIQ